MYCIEHDSFMKEHLRFQSQALPKQENVINGGTNNQALNCVSSGVVWWEVQFVSLRPKP